MRELLPAYASLMVLFDPLAAVRGAACGALGVSHIVNYFCMTLLYGRTGR